MLVERLRHAFLELGRGVRLPEPSTGREMRVQQTVRGPAGKDRGDAGKEGSGGLAAAGGLWRDVMWERPSEGAGGPRGKGQLPHGPERVRGSEKRPGLRGEWPLVKGGKGSCDLHADRWKAQPSASFSTSAPWATASPRPGEHHLSGSTKCTPRLPLQGRRCARWATPSPRTPLAAGPRRGFSPL